MNKNCLLVLKSDLLYPLVVKKLVTDINNVVLNVYT